MNKPNSTWLTQAIGTIAALMLAAAIAACALSERTRARAASMMTLASCSESELAA